MIFTTCLIGQKSFYIFYNPITPDNQTSKNFLNLRFRLTLLEVVYETAKWVFVALLWGHERFPGIL